MKIVIVGVGNLGAVLAQRLLQAGFSAKGLSLVTRGSERSKKACVELSIEPAELRAVSDATVVILAVKPQDAAHACGLVKEYLASTCTVLSVMAGFSCAALQKLLDHSVVVRAMPNLGAGVGESATAYFVPPEVSDAQLAHVEYVVSSCGKAWRVESEHLIDLATAVAGTGPAYLCWLGEQIERAARDKGLSERDAHAMVLQTFKGAVAYLESSSETFSTLRARVTSPNGTTAAAISVLNSCKADEIVHRAVDAAYVRAQELGRGSL
jgi:pyrroline-5-carboxylate reductase